MAHWVRMFAAKSDRLSSVPKPSWWIGELTPTNYPLTSVYMLTLPQNNK